MTNVHPAPEKKMSESPTTLERVFECARAAADKRGSDFLLLEVGELTSYTDYFLLISASSDRRVKSIADAILRKMKEDGLPAVGNEGLREGRWALLDFGDFIVHIFYEEVREMFDLEGLWSDAKRITIPKEIIDAPRKEDEEE